MILIFPIEKYSGRKSRNFRWSWGGGGGGGVKRVPNDFIFFMCSFGVIPHVWKIGHSAIKKNSFFETP